ncbi:iron(III) transport system permease [Klebsiella pneumoniae]|nr:iron(III) transport system permease [Klebsiella pneumoniae]
MNVLRRKWQGLPRGVVVCITALVIYVPLLFIVVQSFLSAPFFSRSKSWSLEAFAFIFTDPDFYLALRSGFILAFGLVIIAIPLGGILAFLMVRTDLPGRRIIEPLILVPIFVSPMVLGFGYVVAAGPVGFFSQWAQQLIGFVPWNIYSMFSIVVIAGLTHVPHAYLYISSALRSVGSDVEEAARTVGATPLQVMTSVSLPMVRPSILYACVLLFFLGLEVFGLMLVLGDPEGNMVLATYLYKLTNKLGTPSYHLMAAVAVVLICITITAGDAPAAADAHRQPLCHHEGQGVPGAGAAAGQMALGRRSGGGGLADGDHRRTAARRGAARFYIQLGRRRVAVG